MDSVVVGQQIVREAMYRLDGSAADPTLPRITIRNPVGVAVVQDATPTRISTGVYQYAFTPDLSAPTGIWTSAWSGVVAGQPLGPLSDSFEVLPVGYVVPVPSSSFTYNLATDVGKIRLYIDDRDMSNARTDIPIEQRSCIFTDEEIGQFVSDAGGNGLFAAAAIALRTVANNRSLLVQRRNILRTDVDYGTIRKDLLAAADAWDRSAMETPADGIAEMAFTDMGMRQIMSNHVLRNS